MHRITRVHHHARIGVHDRRNTHKNNLPNFSATLNALHIEFEKHSKKYEKDGVSKLTAFISNAGGVVELAKTVPAEDDDSKLPPIDRAKLLALTESIREMLLKEAVVCSRGSPLPVLPIQQYFSLGYQNHSLLLVNKTERGVGWFSTCANPKLIQEVLVDAVRRRFDLQHPKVRPLLELIQTQSLPKHLAGLSAGLVEKHEVEGWGKTKFKAERRVLFVRDTGEFVLSPMNAQSGVVSIVKPDATGLPRQLDKPFFADCAHDVLVLPSVLESVEANMLHEFDFNVYDAGPLSSIPKYSERNSASHLMRFKHRADNSKSFNVPFWPCYDTFDQPQYQLIRDPDYKAKPKWKANLSVFWFQQLADVFLDKWLAGHGKHLKRKHQYTLRLIFDRESLGFEFVYRDGEFENYELDIPLESSATCSSAVVSLFASKDLVPVLRSIAYLQADSNIALELTDDLLRLSFTTVGPGGSKHEILVPTLDAEGNRARAPFMLYQPTIVADESSQKVEAEA
ncbi:MAG: hypothetical protein RLZ25_1216 [Pseudomonadota bacterium]|jgi:hypothetical protein